MQLIKKKEQLVKNIETVERYLVEGTNEEQQYIRDLIRRGKCFVAYQVGNETRMAPSRFLGYIQNNILKHTKARSIKAIDGRETNPVISTVLDFKLQQSVEYESLYLKYCNSLGITPADHKNRKYWGLKLDTDFAENMESTEGFPEGKTVERIHKRRERNPKVISIAKETYRRKNGKLTCQACGFNFEKVYGQTGIDFIEGHHIIPVSEMEDGHITKPEEIALLCSNCHRMIHKKRPWLTMKNLKTLLKKKVKPLSI